MIYSIITGTGSYIPTKSVKNEDFLAHKFYDTYDKPLEKPNQEVIDKFLEITTIAERRHVTDDLVTSDIAFFAAEEAIKSAGIDKEDLDYIIFAHNFGDVKSDNRRTDIVPALASRVKNKLGIMSPDAVAYDLPFGCPGWLQAVIQADYFIRSGDAKKILVIGADVLSRISDPHDRDSMLYADGAGAVIMEGKESAEPIGIIAHKTRSDTQAYLNMLHMGKSFKVDDVTGDNLYLKMNGRRLYQYALDTVPMAIKAALDKSGIHINEISKVLIHQANGKMDDAILKRLYALYGIPEAPADVMPMSISWLGNSSVATLPTLFDLIMKENLHLENLHIANTLSADDKQKHQINPGDTIVFASVGAGMNINALVYKVQ
ncbi:MAG: 3-oxoacyl-ACP synthase [Bacteroidetes bacterium HGW-Bacteroidetes-8]|jgi:3-oxoacyl-[acyl-carrier-protein] synthase-3|nr:MAG: 3-oxoacyl-ACP synthase [Bacteroidetes bacterium HGW-Bacteroidetes-8]